MSSRTSIFSKILEIKHSEVMHPTSPEEFDRIVNNRRSVRVYTGDKIPRNVMEKVLDWGLLAPNSSNLQAWEFYWVHTPVKKAHLVEACLNQPAARTAQELIVVVAKLDNWKVIRKQMLERLEKEENVPQSAITYYKKLVPLVYYQGPLGLIGLGRKIFLSIAGIFQVIPREPTSRSDMRVWAVKSASLACENIMLGFSAHGFDSCPMEGFDSVRVKKILGLGRSDEVVMVISAGKRDARGVYGSRIRMPREQFVKEV